MPERLRRALPLGLVCSLLVILLAGIVPAQEPVPIPLPAPGQPGQPAPPAQGDDTQVLAKGPVHEAFAATAEAPAATPVVAKQPPTPIEELPPDQKPEGDNVQWLPGYWHWDEEAARYIWISGFWRQPPPGRVWVPGTWREAAGGWQWVSGFWQPVAPPQPQQPVQLQQPQVEYLAEPPASVEVGPTVAAPTATSFYVPGSWVWRGRYVWRPGVWVEYRPSWVWVPARFQWTPAGYVFVDGYWDYPLGTRGVMFAPVVIPAAVYARPGYVYTPVYVVSEPCMVGALFVRRGYGCYYFGDYYDPGYATVGYSAWCGVYTRNGFTVGFGVGRAWGYDPLWSYYSVTYRNTPGWNRNVGDLYAGRYRGEIARPPVTLVQQNVTINNITKTTVVNVTNNVTVVNGATIVNNKDVSHVTMVAPLKVAPDLQRVKYQPVTVEARRTAAVSARELHEVGVQRSRMETALVAQGPVRPAQPGQPAVAPRSIKLDVPKTAVARAQVVDEKKAPPPTPHPAAHTNPAHVDPPKVEPKGSVILPKGPNTPLETPHTPGTPGTLPKVEPKGPGTTPEMPHPKVDTPGTPSKVDPKGPLHTPPKIDPKGPLHTPPKGPQKSDPPQKP